jgi:enoyl-CoA hydratase/carnithine racemase
VRLPRLVGEGRVRDIILTGRKVTADECYRLGLCERLAPGGDARTGRFCGRRENFWAISSAMRRALPPVPPGAPRARSCLPAD